MANENLDDSLIPIAIQNLTKHTTEEECCKAYGPWAKTYSKDIVDFGYVAFNSVADTFDSTMKKSFGEQRKTMKILDVGAGTGLVGEILRGRGYTHIDALDICQEMLDVAKEKNIYNKYICAALSAEPVSEIATGEYDGLISSGTFTEGHVGPGGFREVVRQVKSGGLITLSVRKDCVDNEELGYAAVINKLIEDGKWEMISKDLTDQCTVGPRTPERYRKCYVFVFKVL